MLSVLEGRAWAVPALVTSVTFPVMDRRRRRMVSWAKQSGGGLRWKRHGGLRLRAWRTSFRADIAYIICKRMYINT